LVVIAVNDRPTAMHDAVAANENSAALIFPSTLLANDSDSDQLDRDYVPSLVVESVANAMNGTVTLEAGVIAFTPDSNFTGIASFEYTLSDGYLTDTTSVGVAVGLPNTAPIAVDDALEIAPTISTMF